MKFLLIQIDYSYKNIMSPHGTQKPVFLKLHSSRPEPLLNFPPQANPPQANPPQANPPHPKLPREHPLPQLSSAGHLRPG